MIGYDVNQQRLTKFMLISVAAGVLLANSNSIGFILSAIYWGTTSDTETIKAPSVLWLQALNIFLVTAPISFLCVYFYLLLSIRMRFKFLNTILWNAQAHCTGVHIVQLGVYQVYNVQSDGFIDILNTISIQHEQLVDSVGIINKCFSFQVRLTVGGG